MNEIKPIEKPTQTTIPVEHAKGCSCVKCGSNNVQVWSRITGYYQNVDGWNKGKIQELKDRKKYGA